MKQQNISSPQQICNVRVFDYVDTIQLIVAILMHISKCALWWIFFCSPSYLPITGSKQGNKKKERKTYIWLNIGRKRERKRLQVYHVCINLLLQRDCNNNNFTNIGARMMISQSEKKKNGEKAIERVMSLTQLSH